MNRCFFNTAPQLTLAIALACAALTASPADAQGVDSGVLVSRELPKAALLGRLTLQQPPDVVLNGHASRLSPGARLRDANNQIAMSGALVGQTFAVKYLLDSSGLLSQAWILTADEVQASRKRFSLNPFGFGADAAAGPTDDGKTPFDQLPRYPRQ